MCMVRAFSRGNAVRGGRHNGGRGPQGASSDYGAGGIVLRKIRTAMRSRGRALFVVLLVAALSAVGVHAAAGQQSAGTDPIASGWNAQQLEKDSTATAVQNNLVGN